MKELASLELFAVSELYVTHEPVPHPRKWVGLTDDEIDVADKQTWDEDHKSWGIHDFARLIEAKLKEKNQ